jgi:DNA-binding NarL/FixJ family response regulator
VGRNGSFDRNVRASSTRAGWVGLAVVSSFEIAREALVALLQREGIPEPPAALLAASSASDLLAVLCTLTSGAVALVALVVVRGASDEAAYASIQELSQRASSRVLAYGLSGGSATMRRAFSAGATGYLDERATISDLRFGLNRVRTAGRVMRVSGPGNGGRVRPTKEVLGPREREVLQLAAVGLTDRQIALRLSLALRTITTYMNHIHNKLGVTNRVSAVMWAARAGLIEVNPSEPERAHVSRSRRAPTRQG